MILLPIRISSYWGFSTAVKILRFENENQVVIKYFLLFIYQYHL